MGVLEHGDIKGVLDHIDSVLLLTCVHTYALSGHFKLINSEREPFNFLYALDPQSRCENQLSVSEKNGLLTCNYQINTVQLYHD